MDNPSPANAILDWIVDTWTHPETSMAARLILAWCLVVAGVLTVLIYNRLPLAWKFGYLGSGIIIGLFSVLALLTVLMAAAIIIYLRG